jgi:hypothetical protein
MVDKLYVLDGMVKPTVTDDQISAALAVIRRRAEKPNSLRFPQKNVRFIRLVRFVSAACAAVVIFLFINYGAARLTGACLLSKVDVNFCCHTVHCPDTEEANHSEHS